MTEQLPVPNPPAAPRQPGICGLFGIMESEFKLMERSVAGFTSFYNAWRQATQGVQQGERAVGIPLLASKGTATGTGAVDVVTDLRDINPQDVPMVLGSLASAHGVKIRTCCERMAAANQELYNMINRALSGGQEPAQVPAPASQLPPQATPMVAPQQLLIEDDDDGDESQPLAEQAPEPVRVPAPAPAGLRQHTVRRPRG